jgi:probable O-glycosylation ligase (exosortase A-associated)
MRELFILVTIPLGLLWGLTSARRSILFLCWICFMRPHDFSWGLWTSLPTFKMAVATAFASCAYHGQLRFKFPPILLLYLSFLAWAALCCLFAYNTGLAWAFYLRFLITFWVVSVLIFAAINDLTTLKYALWVSAGSLGVLAAKTGGMLTLKGGGHVTDQINGFVGDNNVFGLTVCLAIGCVLGLKGTLPKKKLYLAAFYFVAFFMVMCVIFTKSRGAFLSLGIILLLSNLASRNPIRNTLMLAAVVGAAYLVIPAQYFDRMDTFKDIQADDSAMSRVFFWHLSWLQALSHPVFGIGLDNHMLYNLDFYRAELGNATNHVAHSVYFQILAETGFVGLAIYLAICLSTLFALHRTHARARAIQSRYPDLAWVVSASFWMRNAFFGYMFGSAFLNMLIFDFPWYFIWFSHMLGPLLAKETSRRRNAENRNRQRETAAAPKAVAQTPPPSHPDTAAAPSGMRGREKTGAGAAGEG